MKSLKDFLETVEKLMETHEEIGILIEMAYEENDASLISEISEYETPNKSNLNTFCSVLEKLVFAKSMISPSSSSYKTASYKACLRLEQRSDYFTRYKKQHRPPC